jgi:hypothetical protein
MGDDKKTLVLYVFHERNERVDHFFAHGFFADPAVDFIVIANGVYLDPAELPPYVKYFPRENIGYDFGAWSDALLQGDLYQHYETFLFINSSVLGPFMPTYYPGKWTDVYLRGLSDSVKLFGSTISTREVPHVQSYAFALDRATLVYLIACGIFSRSYVETFNDAIWQKEVLMSRKVLDHGWNIGCLLPLYQGVDFRIAPAASLVGPPDVSYPEFEGIYWTKEQLVFPKGNRGAWKATRTLWRIERLYQIQQGLLAFLLVVALFSLFYPPLNPL